MPKTPDPKDVRIAPIAVTREELAEIDRRAAAAKLTRADYLRRRGLGEVCGPALRRVTVQG